MTKLTNAMRNKIRFETNYQHHVKSLEMINKPRFRALGDDHCRAFITHAADMGDRMKFDQLGSVAYLMFLMTWLGSHFMSDPRHGAIQQALAAHDTEEERMENARAAFLPFAEKHVGDKGEILTERIAALEDLKPLAQDQTPQGFAKLHDALLDTFKITGADRDAYRREAIEQQAVASAVALDIDTGLGRNLSLVLTILLGTRFHTDPLFPWVPDTVATAQSVGKPADAALFDYALKRMAAVLRH